MHQKYITSKKKIEQILNTPYYISDVCFMSPMKARHPRALFRTVESKWISKPTSQTRHRLFIPSVSPFLLFLRNDGS